MYVYTWEMLDESCLQVVLGKSIFFACICEYVSGLNALRNTQHLNPPMIMILHVPSTTTCLALNRAVYSQLDTSYVFHVITKFQRTAFRLADYEHCEGMWTERRNIFTLLHWSDLWGSFVSLCLVDEAWIYHF